MRNPSSPSSPLSLSALQLAALPSDVKASESQRRCEGTAWHAAERPPSCAPGSAAASHSGAGGVAQPPLPPHGPGERGQAAGTAGTGGAMLSTEPWLSAADGP